VLALSAVLLVWSGVSPLVPAPWKTLAQAAFGALLARGVPLGWRPPRLWSGVRWGASAAVPIVAAVAVSAMHPRVRAGLAGRDLPASPVRWVLLDIPLGTVVSEELAYRGALDAVASATLGARGGRLASAAVFGLSHVPDARAAGESVPGTVLVTGAAGWAFSWLAARSGSIAAPMLAHLAVNEAGAVAALVVRGRLTG
jgi:uncharacterized protein